MSLRQATPRSQLEREFMSPNTPLKEREHWARNEIERLQRICRDAYEVWAGSEGIPEPETAAEAYLLQLLEQMRDEIKKGL